MGELIIQWGNSSLRDVLRCAQSSFHTSLDVSRHYVPPSSSHTYSSISSPLHMVQRMRWMGDDSGFASSSYHLTSSSSPHLSPLLRSGFTCEMGGIIHACLMDMRSTRSELTDFVLLDLGTSYPFILHSFAT